MKKLPLDSITITVERRTQRKCICVVLCFMVFVADLFNNCRLSKAGRDCISANGDRIKVHFMKESFILIEYGKSQFLLHLLLIYMCDFLVKKESPLRVISNLRSCFLIIPPEITQSHFLFLLMM